MIKTRITDYIWNSGVTCLLISCTFFAVAAALVRVTTSVGVFELVCFRSGLSLFFSYILFLATAPNGTTDTNDNTIDPPVPRRFFGAKANILFLAARGLAGSLAMVCFYEGLYRLPLGESVLMLYMNPPLTAILAWIVLGEKFGLLTAGGCLCSFIGVVFVAQPPFIFSTTAVEWSHKRMVGLIYAGASALLASVAYMAIRMVGNKETPLTVAVWFHTSALISSVVPLLLGIPRPASLPIGTDWACLLGIAVCSFVANLLLNRGFQIEMAAKASAINFMQVIYAHIIGLVFFNEQPTVMGLIGAGLIAVGLMAVTLSKERKKTDSSDSSKALGEEEEERIPLTTTVELGQRQQ